MIFSKSDYARRLSALQERLDEIDAIIIYKDENLRYLTGVDSGRLIVWKDGAKFFLNEVYFDRAKESHVPPEEASRDAVKRFLDEKDFKRIGVDSISYAAYRSVRYRIRKLLRPSLICEELRKIKDKKEMDLLLRAGKIASDAFETFQNNELTGLNEFEIAALVEAEIRKNGSEKPPFGMGMLCLSGPNTRYPHAPASERKLKEGDLLVLDFGAVYKGYHSDVTRTLRVGKVDESKEDIASFVESLRADAIDRVEIGGSISKLHAWIESKIEEKGYKFAHLSGHGVGLEIHEKPSLGPSEKDCFEDGMVFTIEPGIYTTKFGARSEDTVALSSGRKKILTR